MSETKKYFVFISYSSKDNEDDNKWAEWLLHELDHWNLPATYKGRKPVQDNLREVFRDRDGLSAGKEWDKQVESILKESKNLIVICSPNAAQSNAVNKEVEFFVNQGKEDFIFPFIIDGNGHEKCFPPALKHSKVGGDVKKDGGRDKAFIKVVAGMLDVNFDDLYNRYELEKAEQARLEREKREKLQIAQSRFVAEKAIDIASEDSFLAQRLAIEVLPEDLCNPNRPYVSEAEKALRLALQTKNALLYSLGLNLKTAIFSPDGKLIASISLDGRDGCVSVFEVNDRTLIRTFKTKNSGISYIAFSPDGQYIAAASIRSIYVWRIGTSDSECVLGSSADGGWTNCFAFNPKRNIIVSASSTGIIEFWDFDLKKLVNSIAGHDAPVYSIAFSPDGNRFVTGSKDKSIRIWDFETGELIQNLSGHSGWVMKVSYSDDGNCLLSASDDKTIRIWDSKTGEPMKTLVGHRGGVKCAAFSPDGKRVVSASIWDRTMRFWDAESGTLVKTIDNMNNVQSVMYSPNDGRCVLLSFPDKRIRIMDTSYTKADSIMIKEDHWRNISVACFNSDSKIVAYVLGNKIKVINAEDGSLLYALEGHTKEVMSLGFSKDGKKMISSSKDCTVRVWDVETGTMLSLFNNEDGYFDNCVLFSDDGKRVVSATGWGCAIKIRDAENGSLINILKEHSAFVHCVAISPDNKYIASGSWDKSIIIWDANTGLPLNKLLGHNGNILTVAFSFDGSKIVSASSESIKIWNSKTGFLMRTIEGYDSSIYSALFLPKDDTKIISASGDKTIRIWDANSGMLIQTLQGHSGPVNYASFASDGRHIVSASGDSTVRIWSFSPLQDLINQTRERFKDYPLTLEERKKYYLE